MDVLLDGQIRLIATGDVGPAHGPADGYPLERYVELVSDTLGAADILVGNCERTYSVRGVRSTPKNAADHSRQPPEMAEIFDLCGFDVLTTANNHMFDWGSDALLDTRHLLQQKGIAVVGSGKDLDEARRPAVVERKAIRVGVLSYGTEVAEGGAATKDHPGIAFLKTKATYEIRGVDHPVRVHSEPDSADLEMILQDIAVLRPQVDVLIPAFHWGMGRIPRIISDYQVSVAHACIDAGADVVMGHHAHIPKAIEVYRNRAIFYGLGNFCVTSRTGGKNKEWLEKPWMDGAIGNYCDQDPAYPLMPYGTASKLSLLASIKLSQLGIDEVAFLPMMIDTNYRPEVLSATDKRFDEVVQYLEWSSVGFPHSFHIEGDRVIVT